MVRQVLLLSCGRTTLVIMSRGRVGTPVKSYRCSTNDELSHIFVEKEAEATSQNQQIKIDFESWIVRRRLSWSHQLAGCHG
jgi:hypothetical protein